MYASIKEDGGDTLPSAGNNGTVSVALWDKAHIEAICKIQDDEKAKATLPKSGGGGGKWASAHATRMDYWRKNNYTYTVPVYGICSRCHYAFEAHLQEEHDSKCRPEKWAKRKKSRKRDWLTVVKFDETK